MILQKGNFLEFVNGSFNNSSGGSSVLGDPEMIDPKYGVLAHVAFGVIAVLALIGNLLICIVILRRKSLLKKPCNVLILNLAATDLLTALFLAITPDFVLPQNLFIVAEDITGELFCRLIASTYILFTFGKASSLTVMCMAVERWYAVVKPMKYKVTFRKRRLRLYITIVWIFSCFTQINELFQMTSQGGLCKRTDPPYGIQVSQVLTVFHIALTFYIPSVVTWMTFTDVWLSMRKNRRISSHCCMMTNYGVAKRRIVRMCAITAFVLTLCWFPAETFYILLRFKTLVLPFSFYQFTIVLAMFNSCVNPVVYCLSNQEYRKDFIALFQRRDRVQSINTANVIPRKSSSVKSYRKSTYNEDQLEWTCGTLLSPIIKAPSYHGYEQSTSLGNPGRGTAVCVHNPTTETIEAHKNVI